MSDDCISRHKAIVAITACDGKSAQIEAIEKLPSVTPKPKTGNWIKISPAGIYECSECGQNVMTSDICAYKFCHGCGAKMEVSE